MTSNEKQIDVLMRRYAQNTNRAMGGDHLDADEMSAFTEGQLPPAARARYVSHLVDCDQCRQLVSQLAVTSGAAIRAEPVAEKDNLTLWQRITGMFARPALRYAAFAAVALIVAGVAFVALYRPRPTNLVAMNEQPHSETAKTAPAAEQVGNSNNVASSQMPVPQPNASIDKTVRPDTNRSAESSVPTPEALKAAPAPADAEKKQELPEVATVTPGYAPPPPGETQPPSKASGIGGLGNTAGARKDEPSDKLAAARDTAKETDKIVESRVQADRPLNVKRSSDQKGKGPNRNFENQVNQQSQQPAQNAVERRAAAPKTISGDDRPASEDARATRSVGGRKFQKQGSAWVDQKFKASMALINVTRGSEEFNALDSGLRSIAQQLSGQVIVVWKGKAYLIR